MIYYFFGTNDLFFMNWLNEEENWLSQKLAQPFYFTISIYIPRTTPSISCSSTDYPSFFHLWHLLLFLSLIFLYVLSIYLHIVLYRLALILPFLTSSSLSLSFLSWCSLHRPPYHAPPISPHSSIFDILFFSFSLLSFLTLSPSIFILCSTD